MIFPASRVIDFSTKIQGGAGLNLYTHVGLEDAENELRKMKTLEGARKELGISDKDDKPLKQNMFKVV